MVGKSLCRIEFDKNALQGISTLNEKQIAALNQQSQRLRNDLTYVIVPQFVHSEKLPQPVNGNEFSNRVFAIGVNAEGQAIQAVTLSVNGLRARHYGVIAENPNLRVSAVKNDAGLMRAERGTTQYSVFANGALPIVTAGDKAYISRPFAFKVTGRNACYNASFKQVKEGYDMETYNEDGKDYIKFTPVTMNKYEEVDNVPAVDTNGIIDEIYTKDLPK